MNRAAFDVALTGTEICARTFFHFLKNRKNLRRLFGVEPVKTEYRRDNSRSVAFRTDPIQRRKSARLFK
jgi:hypothetical protein